ncbi:MULTISPECIES: hypothetical protein [Actinomadura]|uniref:Uncharacterized protein n=1 Tax=Actinomadura yumaensis TaxID=111807 RepID=A0ABW2CER3_9ACTN|nr:hypothetical protein [Actinomadura sp. J1-007]MWK34521.1 hypothetical protein [Actinomadura sp. J1-007]
MVYKNLGRRTFRIKSDGSGLAANVVQVEGGKARGRLGRAFAASRDYSPVVLQFESPDGAPLFRIERPADTGYPIVRSLAGEVLGHFHRSDLGSDERGRSTQDRVQILDAHKRVVCNIVWEVYKKAVLSRPAVPGKNCDYLDTEGNALARFDSKRLVLHRDLPEPMRTLIVASPVAFDLEDGA